MLLPSSATDFELINILSYFYVHNLWITLLKTAENFFFSYPCIYGYNSESRIRPENQNDFFTFFQPFFKEGINKS